QREPTKVQPVGSSTRPLANDNVEFEVLHGGIEDFFDVRLKPVNFVDEEDVTKIEVGEDCRQVTFELNQRTCRRPEMGSHFISDHRGERGFSQPRRSVKQNVIQRLSPLPSRSNRDLEILLNVPLPDVFLENTWAKRQFELSFFRKRHPGNN